MPPLGLYLSIPFCRAKCSFCNFASDAFAPGLLPSYIDRLCAEIASARTRAASIDAQLPEHVDTLYLGGGTPSLLAPAQVRQLFAALRDQFRITPDAEITVEAAPGQLAPETLAAFAEIGVNRLSFGVQSFVDRESAAIGRLHTSSQCLAELDRARAAGIPNLSLDLIAGLPHQTEASWRHSVGQAIDTGVPHISVYLLEIDEDSRLGRELLREGPRYGAPTVPTDDQAADLYEIACTLLEGAGIHQYEISNFARPGFQSAHNLKYWRRQPYLGLGLDAHSMLRSPTGDLRFSNPDTLETYLQLPTLNTPAPTPPALQLPAFQPPAQPRAGNPLNILSSTPAPDAGTPSNLSPSHPFPSNPSPSDAPQSAPLAAPHRLTGAEAFEETIFLGLRLNEGISLHNLEQQFGTASIDLIHPALEESAEAGLLHLTAATARLTPRGRVLSNEVFSRLLLPATAASS